MWTRKSPYGVTETLDRLERVILRNDDIIRFARIDQADVLRASGQVTRPCEMLLFENRVLASEIVAANPEAAFDLPIRALAWEDDAGEVWLRVTDPDQIGRATASNCTADVIGRIQKVLAAMLDAMLAG